jgi:hypothetical protein
VSQDRATQAVICSDVSGCSSGSSSGINFEDATSSKKVHVVIDCLSVLKVKPMLPVRTET